jgi:hypothetical protein
MNRELELVRAISIAADGFYGDAKGFGETAARCFRDEKGGKSQIKNLESIASSALKVSDVLDYVKKQTSKDNAWKQDEFGTKLLRYLEEDLSRSVGTLALSQPVKDAGERQRAHIQLIRQFANQIAAHYEFTRSGVAKK